MDSSQCPLSKYLSPICGSKSHQFIRNIRSDVETTSKKGELPPSVCATISFEKVNCYNSIREEDDHSCKPSLQSSWFIR